jgi:hypothetical protein
MFTKITLFTALVLAVLTFTGVAVAGDTRGPRVAHSSVEAFGTHSYTFFFRGEERWAIAVSGDGDTDLDCYLYDAGGNLVASDDDASDECRLGGVPRWTGTFTLRIVNRGRVYNTYDLATN